MSPPPRMRSRLLAPVIALSALVVAGCQSHSRQVPSQVPAPTHGIFGSTPGMMPKLSYDVTSGLIAVDSGAPVYLTVLAVEPRTGRMSVVFPPAGYEKRLSSDVAFRVDLRDEVAVANPGSSELDAINRGRCANPGPAPSGGIPACVPGRPNVAQPVAPERSLLAIATNEPIVVANDSTNPGKGRGIRRYLPDEWAGAWLSQGAVR